MNAFKLIIASVLPLFAFATSASAQGEEIAQRFVQAIVVEQQDTLSDLQATYERGRAELLALAARGASQVEIQRAAREIVGALGPRATQGQRAVVELRDRGLSTLERVSAPRPLMAYLMRTSSVALKQIQRTAESMVRTIEDLAARLG